MILCLDLGTTTGYAMLVNPSRNPRVDLESGAVNLSQSKFDGGGMRYLKFRNWLDEQYERWFLASLTNRNIINHHLRIYFEAVTFKQSSLDAAHVYGGFLATLTSWCEEKQVSYAGVPVGTIKKFITGKGNAKKPEIIKAVISKLKLDVKNDNEADALALLDYTINQYSWKFSIGHSHHLMNIKTGVVAKPK